MCIESHYRHVQIIFFNIYLNGICRERVQGNPHTKTNPEPDTEKGKSQNNQPTFDTNDTKSKIEIKTPKLLENDNEIKNDIKVYYEY